MKKYAATILVRIRRENCEMLHWSTRRREHARVSIRCKQTYCYGSSYRCSVNQVWAADEKKNETQNKNGSGKCNWTTSACTTLCSYERMSWGIATAREQYSVVRLLMIDWRWTISATAKEDYGASHSHTDSSSSSRRWSQVWQQHQSS